MSGRTKVRTLVPRAAAVTAAGAVPTGCGLPDHETWTTVELTADDDGDAPSDPRTPACRALFVEGTAHGRDRWTGTGPPADVSLKPVRSGTGKPWRVAEVTSAEAAVPPSAPASSSSPAARSALSSSTDRPE
jgi:hypothetical protein